MFPGGGADGAAAAAAEAEVHAAVERAADGALGVLRDALVAARVAAVGAAEAAPAADAAAAALALDDVRAMLRHARSKGDADTAERLVRFVWAAHGDAAAMELLADGMLATNRGAYDIAERALRGALARDAHFAEACAALAALNFARGRTAEALELSTEALVHRPDHFGLLGGAGLCHMQERRWAEAVKFLSAALHENPNAGYYHQLSRALRKMGEQQQAPPGE